MSDKLNERSNEDLSEKVERILFAAVRGNVRVTTYVDWQKCGRDVSKLRLGPLGGGEEFQKKLDVANITAEQRASFVEIRKETRSLRVDGFVRRGMIVQAPWSYQLAKVLGVE